MSFSCKCTSLFDTFLELNINEMDFQAEGYDLNGVPAGLKNEMLSTFEALREDDRRLVLAFSKALIQPELPEKAPKFYADREDKSENPIEFIRKVYEEHLSFGLPRAHIKKLDPKLYVGLMNWLRQNEIPRDVHLPRREERYDQLAGALERHGGNTAEIAARLEAMAKGLSTRSPS